MCELCKNKKKLGEICLDCHKQKIQEVKKEILDDVEKEAQTPLPIWWNELKKRHLSTFQKEKRHNSSSKKDCRWFGKRNVCLATNCNAEIQKRCELYRPS